MSESRVDAGINFDTSQLTQGAADTVEGLQSIADQATVTATTVKTRSQSMADDAKAAAATITDADLRIAEAARAVAVAKKEQQSATKALTKGIGSESDALVLSAVAMQKARAASLELAEAQKAVAVASHQAITDVQATSGAIRSLEGNAGIRAVENFVSKTLGLGPAMQAIFPLIGAAAFAEILFGLGEKLVEIGDKAANAASNIRSAFEDLHGKAEITNDDLRITDDKLKDQIAKLEGNPGDGLQTALDEAIKRADQLVESLKADNKAIQEIFKQNAVGAVGGFLANVETTGVQTEQLEQDNKDLIKAVRTAKSEYVAALNASSTTDEQEAAAAAYAKAVHDATQKKIDAYKTEMLRLKKEESDSAAASLVDGAARNVDAPIVNNSAKLANLQGVIDTLQDRLDNQSIAESTLTDQKKVGQLKQANANDAGDSSAKDKESDGMKDMIRQMEEDARTAEKIHEGLTAIFQADLKQQDEASRKSAEQQRADAEQFRRDQQAKIQALSEVARASIEDAQSKAAMAEEAISAKKAEGEISALGAAKQLAAVHTQEYIDKLKALKVELDALSNGYGGSIDPKKSDQVQNEITKTQSQQQVTGQKDTAAVANGIATPYLTAFNQVNSGWLKLQNDLIAGNRRFGQDARKMGLQLVQDAAANFEKLLIGQIQFEIRKAALHRATVLANNATDASGAAVSVATSKAANMSQGISAATLAFKNTYAVVSGWPLVGPVLAPVLAAGAFAAVAAFEQGGIVDGQPGMAVPILAHAGERVLTPSQTTNFESMVNNSKTGGDAHFYFGNKYSGSSSDVKSQAQQSDRDFARRITRLHREGKLSVPAR